MEKIRVLYIHHGLGIGGAPLSLLFLLQKLDRVKYEPVVLCLYESAAADLYRKEGIETHVVSGIKDFAHTTLHWYQFTHLVGVMQFLHRVLHFIPSIVITKSFAEKHAIDLVHLNSTSLAACAIGARRAGIPVVWHIREPLAAGYFGIRRSLLRHCIHRYANRVIAICENDADQLIRNENVRVIYNFVDFGKFDKQLSGKIFRREFDIPDGTKLVAMLGGVSKVKGSLIFIQALKSVKNKYSDVKFLVVGDASFAAKNPSPFLKKVKMRALNLTGFSSYSQQILNYIQREGLQDDVIFSGVRQDIPRLLAAVDILVFPSIVPHFARPIIEAGAMAKPVVASDLGGPRELVVHGQTGFLVPSGNVDKLADAIIDILSNDQLAENLGEAGYTQAQDLFSASKNAVVTFDVYVELLEKEEGD